MAMRESEQDRVCRQGTEAWRRLKKGKNWNDWLMVGEALQVGRDWAMHQAGTNQPVGKAYNVAFSEWLRRYKLDDMDKGDRARLFKAMDNRPAIEEWRQTLTMGERLKLNHPQAVLRKWQAYIEPERREGKPKRTLRESVANLDEQLTGRDRRIAELEAVVQEAHAAAELRPPAEPSIDDAQAAFFAALIKQPIEDQVVRMRKLVTAMPWGTKQLAEMTNERPFLIGRAPAKRRRKATSHSSET